MSTALDQENPRDTNHRATGASRRARVGVYAAAGLLGVVLGLSGFNVATLERETRLSALAHVGYALTRSNAAPGDTGWDVLARELPQARQQLPTELQPVFDLVAAGNGLATRGQPQPSAVQQLCASLNWPRCDAALTALSPKDRP